MAIADNLAVSLTVGTAPVTSLLSPPLGGSAVQDQANETAILESLVALGAMKHRGQSGPRGSRRSVK